MTDENQHDNTEATPETGEAEVIEAATLPEDHPLVRTLAAQKEQIKELKARTQKLDEIEDAQKTEAQRAAERIAELESQASAAQQEALRFRVASKHGIDGEDAELFLTASDEETLTKQAERLVAHRQERKIKGPFAPSEGRTVSGSSGGTPADMFAAALTEAIKN